MAIKKFAVMPSLKRGVLIALLLCLVSLGGVVLFRNTLAEMITRAALSRVQEQLKNANISLHDVGYTSVHAQIKPLLQLEGANVRLSALFPQISSRQITANAQVDTVDVSWRYRTPGKLLLEADSIDGILEPGSLPENIPFDGLKEGTLRYELSITDLMHPKQMENRLKTAVFDLYTRNYTKENFRFKGDLCLRFDNTPFCVGFYSVAVRGGGTVFRLDEQDLRLIARNSVENECSDEEIKLMVNNPLKTPYIIYASLKCRQTVQAELNRNPNLPYDAYRHVLWSYYLTRKLGAEFAQKVTDAREQRSDNNEAEHEMDYHNNKIGARYALDGVPESEILSRVLSDPNVILKHRS